MTDRHDDEDAGTGIPERTERTDSGGHVVTDSGRHVTNRNVVPRASVPASMSTSGSIERPAQEPRGARDAREPMIRVDDDFDVVTPVLPQPRDVFVDEEATLTHGDDDGPGGPAAAPADPSSEAAPGPSPQAARAPSPAEITAARSDAIMARVRERLPRITPSPLGALPPESRRASTEPGHVEPRRRPTPPPKLSTAPDEPVHASPSSPSTMSSAPGRTPTGPLPRPMSGPARTPTGPLPRERLTSDPDRTPTGPLPRGRATSDPDRTPTGPGSGSGSRGTTADSRAALLDSALRVVAVLAVLGLGAAGLAQPTSVLRGGIAWLGFLFFVLAGWGAIVSRIARAGDLDIGLRAALGAAGYLAVASVALAAGILTRPVILALIGAGVAGFAWHELTAPVAIWQRIRDGLVYLRTNPALGVLVIVIALVACVRMVGAIAALDRNPWDDDLAYTPLVKRMLDIGDLVEPFSFRRLGSYGGQTVLDALAASRGTLANVHLIDKGLFLGLTLLGITGYARERSVRPLWLALIAVAIVLLPDTAINTASYWSGVALFLALYRCVVRQQWALAGLVAAAICTLRQNFLVVVAVFLAAVLLSRLVAAAREMPLREAWGGERRHWAQVIAIAVIALVPWWVAAFRSSDTFLYPLIDGTWNHQLSLNPAVVTWGRKLEFLLACSLEPTPVTAIPVLALVIAFVSDRRPGKPLVSLFIATCVGFFAIVVSLVGTESVHIWRYVFGFGTALFALLVIEIGAEDDPRIGVPALGRWLALAAIVLAIIADRTAVPRQYVALLGDVREAAAIDNRGDPSARAESRRYAAMQAALPEGAPAVILLDDPAFLDFRRNPLANLDVPGLASPAPQLPSFGGAEALREYFVALGYRHAAFVRPERSRYFFRRAFWLHRMFWDSELFQVMGAYTIDMIDALSELATTTAVLYDADGLVVLDLGAPLRAARRRAVAGDEPTRRSQWVRELADREGLHDAWSLTTRADLRFEDGVGALRYVDGSIDDPRWYEVTHVRPEPARRGQAILPLQRRALLRVRGTGPRRLVLRAAIALNTVYTHPRLDVSLDGELLTSAVADAAGKYVIDVTVPGDRLRGGWHDLYLVFSSIAEPARELRDFRIARLESVEWTAP